jgi:hypothetical protein
MVSPDLQPTRSSCDHTDEIDAFSHQLADHSRATTDLSREVAELRERNSPGWGRRPGAFSSRSELLQASEDA